MYKSDDPNRRHEYTSEIVSEELSNLLSELGWSQKYLKDDNGEVYNPHWKRKYSKACVRVLTHPDDSEPVVTLSYLGGLELRREMSRVRKSLAVLFQDAAKKYDLRDRGLVYRLRRLLEGKVETYAGLEEIEKAVKERTSFSMEFYTLGITGRMYFIRPMEEH